MPDLEELKTSEWNEEFEKLCRNRLLMGAFRYGLMARAKSKQLSNHIQSALDRLQIYAETGNAEHLVDVANMCQLEFTHQGHPKFHFKASDDGYHTPEFTANKLLPRQEHKDAPKFCDCELCKKIKGDL